MDVLQEIQTRAAWVSMYLCGQQLLCLEPLVFQQLQMRLPEFDASQMSKHHCACCDVPARLPCEDQHSIWELRWQLLDYFCPMQETLEDQSFRKSQLVKDDIERYGHEEEAFIHVVTRWHEALEDDFRSAAWPRPSLMAGRLLGALLLDDQSQSLGARIHQAEEKLVQGTDSNSSHAAAAAMPPYQSLGALIDRAGDTLAKVTALDSSHATAAAVCQSLGALIDRAEDDLAQAIALSSSHVTSAAVPLCQSLAALIDRAEDILVQETASNSSHATAASRPQLVASRSPDASNPEVLGMAGPCLTGHASDALSAHSDRHLQAVLQSIVTPSRPLAASSAADAASCPAISVEPSFAPAQPAFSQLSIGDMRGVLQCIILQRLSSDVNGATAAVPATSQSAVSGEAVDSAGQPCTSQASLKVLRATLQSILMQGQLPAASGVDGAAATSHASSQGAMSAEPDVPTALPSRSQLSMTDLRAICKLAEINSSTGLISSASRAVRSKVILPCGLSLDQLADVDPAAIDALSMNMHEAEHGPCPTKPLVIKQSALLRLGVSGSSSPNLSSFRPEFAFDSDGRHADHAFQASQSTTEPAASQSTSTSAGCMLIVAMAESLEELLSLVTLSSLLSSAQLAGHSDGTPGRPQLHSKRALASYVASGPHEAYTSPARSAASAAAAASSPSGSAASSKIGGGKNAPADNVPQALDRQERDHWTDPSTAEGVDVKRQQPAHPMYNLVSPCCDMPEYVCRQFSIAALVSTLQGMPIRSVSSSEDGDMIWSFWAAGPAHQPRENLENDYGTYRRLCDDACHSPVPLVVMAESTPASEQRPASSSKAASPAARRRLDQDAIRNEDISKEFLSPTPCQLGQQQHQQLQQQLPATSHEPSAALQAAKDKRSRKQAKSGRKQAASLQSKPDAAAEIRAEVAAEAAAMGLLMDEEIEQYAHLLKAKKAEAKRVKLQQKKAKARHLAAGQTPAGWSILSLNRGIRLHDLKQVESLLC